MICPVCGGRAIGKVGVGQFYCWDCCIEFNSHSDKVVIYDLDEDGSLVVWEDFQIKQEEILSSAPHI